MTQVLGEFRPGDDTYYLLGLDIIGQQRNGQWSYFGYDGLGSVRQSYDATSSLIYAANYDPYGVPFERFGNYNTSLGFAGEHTDVNGLVFLRARYMSPSLGTFLSRDPVMGVLGGQSITFNPYAYAHANPTNLVDPSGKFVNIGFGIFGAIFGGIFGGIAYIGSHVIYNIQRGMPIFHGMTSDGLGQSVLVGAGAGFVGGMTFGLGLAFGTTSAGWLGISTGSRLVASAWGAITVAGSGVVAGQVSRAASNILSGVDWDEGLGRQEDMILDAVLSLVVFKFTGYRFNMIPPADSVSLGPFARETTPATGRRVTRSQSAEIQVLGEKFGCHTCGARIPGGKGTWVGDHVPPTWLEGNTPRALAPQCIACSTSQGGDAAHRLIAVLGNHIWAGRWVYPYWSPYNQVNRLFKQRE
jgi:RHS repeat-associated protein